MYNQFILSIGRKLYAHLFLTCILCALALVVLLGGMIQVISSLAFNAYLQNNGDQAAVSYTSAPMSLILDGATIQQAYAKQANKTGGRSKSLNQIHTSVASFDGDQEATNGNSFLNTKILYRPFTKLTDDNAQKPVIGKGRKINIDGYKSVTPSITDRVIADLKREDYLLQRRAQSDVSDPDTDDNDDAIYIDNDEEELNTPDADSVKEVETSIEKLPDDATTSDNGIPKNKQQSAVLKTPKRRLKHARPKADHKTAPVLSKTVDMDDDDYDDYSGSGYFSNQMAQQNKQENWISPTIEKVKIKRLNKQEQIIKSFADNTYGISDETDRDPMDFVNKDDGQMISKKIAKAHKKQIVKQTNADSQRAKSKQNPSSKRKSKEQIYIDEYFSGVKSANDADDGIESQLVKKGWMEPRIRRILGNLKKSEERSQQILLCQGEGELCSMLFKTPIKTVASP